MKTSDYLSDNMNRVRCPGLQFNDLASLVAGVKTVVYTSVNGTEEARLLDKLCADLKLKKTTLGSKKDVSGAAVTDILIGTDPKKMKAAGKAYCNVLSFEWGIGLDYPECCVKSYIEWNTKRRDRDLIRHILAASPGGRTFPFWMNNIFNYYSRLIRREDRNRYAAFSKLNEGMDRESIIPWHPCSYTCAETAKKGKLIYAVMERYMPLTAAARREMLSRPVVFWDTFRFALLNGRCRWTGAGFAAEYKGLARPRALLGPETGKVLAGLGTLRASPGGRLSGQAGERLPGGAVLIPFAP